MGVSCRIAFTLVGANGSSITDNRAERVSFPPGDVTYQQQNQHLSAFCSSTVFSLFTFECNLN